MKFSALQTGFAFSVLTHVCIFSTALRYQSARNLGANNRAEPVPLEILLIADETAGAADAKKLSLNVAADPVPCVELATIPPAPVFSRIAEPSSLRDAAANLTPMPEPTAPLAPVDEPAPAPGVDRNQLNAEADALVEAPERNGGESELTDAAGPDRPHVATKGHYSCAPSYRFNPTPRYPADARARGQQGQVLVSLVVTVEGLPKNASVRESSGFELLDEAALATVKTWRFVPARLDNSPVASTVEIPINFKLNSQ